MNAITQSHSEFAARLARIERDAATSTQRLFVGVDEVYQVPLRVRKVRRSGGEIAFHKVGVLFEMAFAMGLGAVAHGIGQIGRFILHGVPTATANPDQEMLVQVLIGFGVATMLGSVLGVRWNERPFLKAVGAACGVLFLHNAVHLYPEMFEAATSKAWVDQIIAHTRAHSILWRGVSIPL